MNEFERILAGLAIIWFLFYGMSVMFEQTFKTSYAVKSGRIGWRAAAWVAMIPAKLLWLLWRLAFPAPKERRKRKRSRR
jgi:hypothetical protein